MTPELAHSLDSIFPHIANSRRGGHPLLEEGRALFHHHGIFYQAQASAVKTVQNKFNFSWIKCT